MGSKSKKPAARLGDIGSNHGPWPPSPIITGSSDVLINGIPAARKGDALLLHAIPNHKPHGRSIAEGSSSVLINGKPAARVSDAISCGGSVAIGSVNVLIGDSPTLLAIPDLEIPEVTFTHPRKRSKASQPPAPASASMAVSTDDPVYYTPPSASPITSSQQSAVDYWQQQKNNADNFPAYLAAHLMKLNAETGYSIAEGLTATFEIVTGKDKFVDTMVALKDVTVDTVTDPVGTYNATKNAAVTFSELPLSEQGETLYKASLRILAGGGGAKATQALGKVGKASKANAPLPGLHNQVMAVDVKEHSFKTVRKVDIDNLS